MKVVKKVYKFMDNLYLDYDTCEHDCADWLHKEDIKTVFIVIDQSDLNEIEKQKSLTSQLDLFNYHNPYTFETFKQAEQDIKEEMEILKEIEESKN